LRFRICSAGEPERGCSSDDVRHDAREQLPQLHPD
jgi:hypothetical protein